MKITYGQVDASDPGVKRQLKVLQKACLPADDLYFPEDGVWWMAYHKTAPVGFSCLSPSQQMEDGIYFGTILPHLFDDQHLRVIAKFCNKSPLICVLHQPVDKCKNTFPSVNCVGIKVLPELFRI